jgi:hypothetical protein
MNNVIADGVEPSDIISTAGQKSTLAVANSNSAVGLKPFWAVQSVGASTGHLAGLAAFAFVAYFV